MKKIIYILVLTLVIFTNTLNAQMSDTKINYFIGKKLYFEKKYDIADIIFNKIISENNPSNQYSQKSKLFTVLIQIKKKNFEAAIPEIKNFLKLFPNSKYKNNAYYIYAIIIYNVQNKFIRNIPGFEGYKRDQTQTQKAIKILKNISYMKNEYYFNKVKNEIKKLEIEIKKHEIYIAEELFTKKQYFSVINRLKFDDNFIPEDEYDYKKIYLRIRACNELYLDDIAKNILDKIKKYDIIKE